MDILDQVKETPKAAPNLHDPATFHAHFEKNNSHLGLYYTPQVMSQLYELLADISLRAPTVNL